MPRGLGDISSLRLEVLQGFVTKYMRPPNLLMMNLFGSSNSPSSTVKWESQEGGRGMSPFKPPGAPTQLTAPFGLAQHSAEAAFWGDKMYFDEEFLNNLRKEGTEAEYLGAEQRLARELAGIVIRASRRKEWMFVKMLMAGSFTYKATGGVKISVDYDIPSDHSVTLATADKWQSGTNRDILNDIIDGKKKISDDTGMPVTHAVFNSTVLKFMAQDPSIQTLLQKTTFGRGDLFEGDVNKIVGANPKVIGGLLDIPNFVCYDERYEVRANLTAVVTADSTTTISVDDVTDFEVGDTLRFVDVSANTWEEETISAVNVEAGTLTVSTAPATSYKAIQDYVTVRRAYLPDDKFLMFASQVDGQPIAEYKAAPFGLNRNWGQDTDRWEVKDPDGVFIRVQDKGLPVLYQRDAMYILDVN